MKLCVRCKERTAINKSKQCEICTLKTASQKHFGRSDEWEKLGEKFYEQKATCPWTKLKIRLGTDASVDHHVPKAKGGSNLLTNLNWVHKWFNIIASDSDKGEFFCEFKKFVYKVYHKLRLYEEFNESLLLEE